MEECICKECSKVFVSKDINEVICPECWKKIINIKNEGKEIDTTD